MASPLDQLTEPQKECLRLVLAHHNSKEIAGLLGVSPSAVDKRIERAVQILGVSSRFSAARMLAEAEDDTYERLPCEPIDVPIMPTPLPITAHDKPLGLVRKVMGWTSTNSEGGTRNPLGKLQRLALICGLVLFVALTTVALLNMASTLTRFVSR